jgi:hypothetical protein
MRKRLISILSTMVMALAGTLLAAAAAAADESASQTGPYRIGDPAGERFALVGNPILSTRVTMVPPVEPTSWYHLNQQWHLRDAGSGAVNIVNARLFFGGADYCIVPPPTPAVAPYAHVLGCTGGAEQTWTLQAAPGGVRVVSQTSGDCLTMPPSGAPNSDLRLQPCGDPGQVFVISPV